MGIIQKQSTPEREEYVYNEIMRNNDKFSEAEILFSQRYIYKLRHGNWSPQDWKGFEE
ncbi:zincin-like metallopeptidase toxin domain-containing protein [Paenibacillus alvei]|uniref:zincin-like metallopeptidase toxin domain-containing protein n=1 Tax=Paenibacillus alvei TaxID=44250 RepID=UPI00227E7619|nr:zincin-like metallopeptidase toxin domain-containing protein [Paenibacillus alvei]